MIFILCIVFKKSKHNKKRVTTKSRLRGGKKLIGSKSDPLGDKLKKVLFKIFYLLPHQKKKYVYVLLGCVLLYQSLGLIIKRRYRRHGKKEFCFIKKKVGKHQW